VLGKTTHQPQLGIEDRFIFNLTTCSKKNKKQKHHSVGSLIYLFLI